jgi:hypothetical protein
MKRLAFLILLVSVCNVAAQSETTGLAAIHVAQGYHGADCSSSLIARQIAWSLDHQPRLWKTDGYSVDHKGGGAFWVANGMDDVAIGRDGTALNPGNWNDDCGKQIIWAAYQRWLLKTTGQSP